MITIGYSTKKIDPSFREYITKSVGLPNVEVIAFENPGTHSLTEVYNIILEQSSNDIVVLCHDDIKVKTNKWGQRILDHFNNSDYGIIGVAGTYNYSETGKWWEDKSAMVGIVNHKHPETKKEYESKYSSSVGDNIIPVVSLDGVFMVVKKSKIKYKFDETIKGFHFYDVDFTVGNYLSDVKIGVITNIRILHYSIGMTNAQWEENRVQFAEKWKNNLPLTNNEIGIFFDDFTFKLKNPPKVSIIILSKSANNLLFQCIDSFIEKSVYPNYEIIVGDTGSNIDEISEFNIKYQNYDNIKLVELGFYNFAKNNNEIVKNHISNDTELLLLCNNDIELINDVLSQMVTYYSSNKNVVGTIGARLYYENRTIQHSGMILFKNNNSPLQISHLGLTSRYQYHENTKEVFGNTAALMLINKNLYINVGMLNEEYTECFEDVELNNTLVSLNKKNIFIGNAVAFHYESQTRNKNEGKLERLYEDYKLLAPKIINNQKASKYIHNLSYKI